MNININTGIRFSNTIGHTKFIDLLVPVSKSHEIYFEYYYTNPFDLIWLYFDFSSHIRGGLNLNIAATFFGLTFSVDIGKKMI